MVAAWQVLAQADLPARHSGWDPRLLGATVALILLILLGILVIVWLDRWRKRPDAEPLSANDQLAQFRELYERGELSHEEFERIRTSLEAQLRHEMDVPARPGSRDGTAESEPRAAPEPKAPPP